MFRGRVARIELLKERAEAGVRSYVARNGERTVAGGVEGDFGVRQGEGEVLIKSLGADEGLRDMNVNERGMS